MTLLAWVSLWTSLLVLRGTLEWCCLGLRISLHTWSKRCSCWSILRKSLQFLDFSHNRKVLASLGNILLLKLIELLLNLILRWVSNLWGGIRILLRSHGHKFWLIIESALAFWFSKPIIHVSFHLHRCFYSDLAVFGHVHFQFLNSNCISSQIFLDFRRDLCEAIWNISDTGTAIVGELIITPVLISLSQDIIGYPSTGVVLPPILILFITLNFR